MEKIDRNKLILPTAIVLGCVILGGSLYAIQANKQKSIEKQQQIELQVKNEQDERNYAAKRKTDCLTIYKTESEKWDNVEGWKYYEPSGNHYAYLNDTCEIIYKDDKTDENFSKFY